MGRRRSSCSIVCWIPLSLEKKTFSREGNSCRNQGFCLTFPEKKTRQSYVGGPIIVDGEEGLMERRPDSLLVSVCIRLIGDGEEGRRDPDSNLFISLALAVKRQSSRCAPSQLFSGDFLEIGDIPGDFQLISKSKSPAVVEEQQRFHSEIRNPSRWKSQPSPRRIPASFRRLSRQEQRFLHLASISNGRVEIASGFEISAGRVEIGSGFEISAGFRDLRHISLRCDFDNKSEGAINKGLRFLELV
ncbi:hypothetical protein MRB53_032819 [Persea americana]|uniref:Uncharacterized protein n=1 Tax=Persea americana TaxID=3435 RepID=A0ACC2KSZ0_PERAE|nr:hypothetical protein MRB53_032819 [Persea americana]